MNLCTCNKCVLPENLLHDILRICFPSYCPALIQWTWVMITLLRVTRCSFEWKPSWEIHRISEENEEDENQFWQFHNFLAWYFCNAFYAIRSLAKMNNSWYKADKSVFESVVMYCMSTLSMYIESVYQLYNITYHQTWYSFQTDRHTCAKGVALPLAHMQTLLLQHTYWEECFSCSIQIW